MSTFLKGFVNGSGDKSERATRTLTPRPIVKALGHFDLDPCGAPGWELADRSYLLENGEDGLTLPWWGRIWMNPPYGAEQIPFIERLAEHGHGIALIWAATETRLWHREIWPRAQAVCFVRGRISFVNSDHVAMGAAGKPSALIAYGQRDALALEISGLGWVVKP